ncbi:MAG: agmatinase [Candidatus Bathyarchaeota archaeon]|nr:MAG: agmatinase [Candidatus Bathyarchaeota archaeon]
MSNSELYVSTSATFSGCQKSFDQADYVVVGVPFDMTSTYRTGARFAPASIREASLNIETYSFRSNLDVEEIGLHDLGDLHVSGKMDNTLTRLQETVRNLTKAGKIPVIVGGEHTLTLGVLRAVGSADTAIIDFDAHLDLRNEYMDLVTSHTTFMRRLNEQVKPRRIVELGTRAVCKEELDYAKAVGIKYFTSRSIHRMGLEATVEAVRKELEGCSGTYLTIDMDALDPSFAPAVQNPEPDGLSSHQVLDLVSGLCDSRTIGLDIVEVTPLYDEGTTSILAAKTLFEALCGVESVRRG